MKKQVFYIKPRKETIVSQLEKFKTILSDTINNSIDSINTDYSKFEISSIKKDISKNVDNLIKNFNKIHICTKFNNDYSLFNHYNWKFFSSKEELISFIKNNVILDIHNNEITFEEFIKLNNLDENFNYLLEEHNAYSLFTRDYDYNLIINQFSNIDKNISITDFYDKEFKQKFPTISFDFYYEGIRFLD
jgi:hypothetical protein